MRTIQDVLHRIRGEYLEMPGLRLTASQLQRLCGIEPLMCQVVLKELVDSNFLYVRDGSYARLTDEQIISRPRTAKADLYAEHHSLKAS